MNDECFEAETVECNIELAIRYLIQVADKNDPRTQTDLACIYDYGTEVAQDRKLTAEPYLRAIKLRMPAAMFYIASMLETGEGVA